MFEINSFPNNGFALLVRQEDQRQRQPIPIFHIAQLEKIFLDFSTYQFFAFTTSETELGYYLTHSFFKSMF